MIANFGRMTRVRHRLMLRSICCLRAPMCVAVPLQAVTALHHERGCYHKGRWRARNWSKPAWRDWRRGGAKTRRRMWTARWSICRNAAAESPAVAADTVQWCRKTSWRFGAGCCAGRARRANVEATRLVRWAMQWAPDDAWG